MSKSAEWVLQPIIREREWGWEVFFKVVPVQKQILHIAASKNWNTFNILFMTVVAIWEKLEECALLKNNKKAVYSMWHISWRKSVRFPPLLSRSASLSRHYSFMGVFFVEKIIKAKIRYFWRMIKIPSGWRFRDLNGGHVLENTDV